MDKYYLKYLKYKKKYLELKGTGVSKNIIPDKFNELDYTINEKFSGEIKGKFVYDVSIVHNNKMIYMITFNENLPDGKVILGNQEGNPYDKFLNSFKNMAKVLAVKQGIKNNKDYLI